MRKKANTEFVIQFGENLRLIRKEKKGQELFFKHFYGNIEDYTVLALLPSYLEREGSSLIYMVDDMIKRS